MTEQFISADGYIIVAPMWNYGVPPMLKANIDAVCIARKAFRMTENGADGVISVLKQLYMEKGPPRTSILVRGGNSGSSDVVTRRSE
ncbi:NAD(P)H-dependent oxidoreductase [Brevibacillus sp.]|uniref:NAD(P)H-dependent oxidoreductase n=1 Tax=Brevibacillus TaxID=55080 RepID=UPI000EDC0904|nr:NAD(P)H-dependent oxidoreductase [Brevibacillus sp. HD3.3A]HBZ83168.1 hypothetical protein [Brevibacillus sp.]